MEIVMSETERIVSSVRILRRLYEDVRALASEDRRTISAEIEVLIEEAVQARRERAKARASANTETSPGNKKPAHVAPSV